MVPLEDRIKPGYDVKDGCLCKVMVTETDNGNPAKKKEKRAEYITLLNGVIELTGQTTTDNGLEENRVLNLLFHCVNGKKITATTTRKDLGNGNFLDEFGIDARPALGNNKKGMIADSILAQADYAPRKTVYLQTGWRQIGEKWAFLHGGGAVGADNITVELSGRCQQYILPDTVTPERWITLFRFLELAPKSVIYPLIAFVFLSPLNESFRRAGCEPSFIMWLQGVTGTKKSTLAAAAMNFYGESWNNKSLPHSFKDSGNFLEKSGFLLADVLTVVDDYYPATSRTEAAKMAATAQAIARSWGDRVGRSRMNADTSLRRGYPARGNLLCTGEDAPDIGQSGAARSFVVELKAGDIDIDALSYIQEHPRHLAEVMRGYIEWLIPKYDGLHEQLKSRFLSLRSQAQQSGHGRTVEAIAHLQIGIEMFSKFLVDSGQVTDEWAQTFRAESWKVFRELSAEQARRINQDKPSSMFLSALRELLDTKEYMVEDLRHTEQFPVGKPIGYRDEDFFYLHPDTVYKAVRQFYAQADRNFPLTKQQLYKHLGVEGLIFADANQTTKQKRIRGNNRRWLWLKADAVDQPDTKKEDNI